MFGSSKMPNTKLRMGIDELITKSINSSTDASFLMGISFNGYN